MQYAESILDLVGDTPLVRLTRIPRDLGPLEQQPLILAKLETMNPGGSVKDRIGLPMIEAAERAGLLKPGGTIVEPTSGNTGHGLAIAAAIKGYRCIFVMADKQSSEKQALLRAYGAEVVLCPTNVEPESPESYYSVAARLARDIPGAFKPDQYWNQENPTRPRADDRPRDLGPDRGPDHALRGQRRDRRHDHRRGPLPADEEAGHRRRSARIPRARVLSGDTARPYLTEGVGEDFFPGTYDAAMVDRWVRVSDRDAFAMARRITREEGILAGESCGTAMVAALDEARRIMARARRRRRDAVMVVIFPDGGRNYLSKLYNDEWMRANGLLDDDRRGRAGRRAAASAAPRAGSAGGRPGPHDRSRRRGDRPAPAVRHQPAAGLGAAGRRRPRRDRRLGQREGPPRSGLSRPDGRRADGRRGHGPAAADDRSRSVARRGVRAAVRRRAARSSRSPAAARRASSPSSTSSSTSRTAARVPTELGRRRRSQRIADADSGHPTPRLSSNR